MSDHWMHARCRNFYRLMSFAFLFWCIQAQCDVVIVGGEAGYKPYETVDESGEAVGFHVDLMKAIAREMEMEVRFELGGWEQVRAALIDGEIDVLGMFVSAERAESVDFANPHVIVYHRIFIPADAPPIRSIQDLAGKRVIVQRAAFSHEYLQEIGLDADLVLVDTDAQGLRLLAEGGHDAALLTEHRGRFTLAEGNLEQLTVSGPPVLPVENAFAVRRGNDAMLDMVNRGLGRVMASGEFDRIYEQWLQPYDGRPESDLSPGLLLAAGTLILLLAALIAWQMKRMLNMRAGQRVAERQLEFLKNHDSMTGLINRLAFEKELSQFLDQCDGKADHVLLLINVDQFRLVNENLGHAGGDRVLVDLANHLREIFVSPARIGRLGSDEFIVLMPDTSSAKAIEQGERLLSSVGKLEPRPGMKVSLSIGLVPFDGSANTVVQLLRRADCAGLAAKEDGGHRVHCWHDDDRRLAERVGMLRWVGRIQSAIHEDRLMFFYQPIVASGRSDDRFHAVEMLVRMIMPDGEVLAASQFMPAAERYFLSPEIDRWMVRSVLSWLAENPEVPDCLERININLSGRSLGDDRFLEFLVAAIERHSGMIDKLCFEITETALISNLGTARRTLADLHRKGCRFALDDFGSGLSSMAYLKDLPVDYLKIDGGFVRDIEQDRSALEMVQEINRLGHAVGKLTIAEFVESSSIRDLLTESGIDLLQGYAIGRPAPPEELLAWCRGRATDKRDIVNER